MRKALTSKALVQEPLQLDVQNMPSREDTLAQLKACTASNPLDILVIGGGATGTGTALDAVTRCVRPAGLPHVLPTKVLDCWDPVTLVTSS